MLREDNRTNKRQCLLDKTITAAKKEKKNKPTKAATKNNLDTAVLRQSVPNVDFRQNNQIMEQNHCTQ